MTRRLLFAGALALGISAGCYSSEESFIERASKLECVRQRECNKSAFENQFDGDMDECRQAHEDVWELAFDIGDFAGCDYEPPGGRECIHAKFYNRTECGADATDEINDACDQLCD
jgi:hypothetical protein